MCWLLNYVYKINPIMLSLYKVYKIGKVVPAHLSVGSHVASPKNMERISIGVYIRS